MRKKQKNILGFTLLEVAFVLGVLALFAAIVGPVYRSLQTKNNLSIATTSVVEAIRRAQTLAENGKADLTWGVNLTSGNLTVFAGSSFASRQSAYDENLNLPGGIAVSGLSQIVFNKLTGLPQSTGTTTISNAFGCSQIGINAAGTVNY